jgi:hypothetical protein
MSYLDYSMKQSCFPEKLMVAQLLKKFPVLLCAQEPTLIT